MTYEEAKKILDKIRDGDGDGYSSATINSALDLTGDLAVHEGERSKGVDSPVQEEDWRGRGRRRSILVGTNERRNLQSPWRREFAFSGQVDGARTC
jgi:hypothetical protein